MENWGLITYRETSLLFAPGESSAAAQQWVAIVVAHELAHQWFGNLVTMKWCVVCVVCVSCCTSNVLWCL